MVLTLKFSDRFQLIKEHIHNTHKQMYVCRKEAFEFDFQTQHNDDSTQVIHKYKHLKLFTRCKYSNFKWMSVWNDAFCPTYSETHRPVSAKII